MLNERKLTERELDKRIEAIKGLLSNKRKLVQKYGKDAEKVMYGIATKQAKNKIEKMNLDNLKELIKQTLQKEQGPATNVEPYHDQTKTVDTGFSGRADYGEEDKALGQEDELEMKGLEEGHGLSQKDIDVLKNGFNAFFVAAPKYGEMDDFKRVIKFILKSNILQDKTKDLSKGKVNEQYDENDIDMAINDLRNAADEIESAGEDAREIVRQYFPNELSRLDAYGAFSGVYSANRYDVTLGRFIDRLEEEGYEIEDGVAYVNEGHMVPMDDLDVGHTDNEPHMLKKELARAGQMIQMLYRAVDKYDGQGEVDFPQWWQKKIIQANAMLDSAFDYIDGEEMVAKIDAMIDNMDKVEIDIDVVNEEEDVQKRLDAEKAIRQTLKDEGGAAGLAPLVKAVKKFGFNKEQLVKLLKKIVKVDKHKHGDYILTPINEVMDGGQLFDYFSKKGYKVEERSPDGREAGFKGYMVSRGDGPYPQSVIFQYDKDVDQFMISRMGGYRIDQDQAVKAGMRQQGYSGVAGRDAYITDGNYKPVDISSEGLKDIVDHVMTGLDRESKAQGDFYRARGRTSGTIDEKELSKSEERKFKKIEKELNKASKMHKSQADRIGKIVKEKLTKRSKVDDFVDDFKKSDAKQFKGKSADKKRKMAVAAYLAKQNDK